jgi:hypothetical protein
VIFMSASRLVVDNATKRCERGNDADYRLGSLDLSRVIDAMCRIAAIGCPDLRVNPDRRRPVRLQDDCESVVILGMGIRLGNRG